VPPATIRVRIFELSRATSSTYASSWFRRKSIRGNRDPATEVDFRSLEASSRRPLPDSPAHAAHGVQAWGLDSPDLQCGHVLRALTDPPKNSALGRSILIPDSSGKSTRKTVSI
jgi:hypothetical protein